MHYRPRNGRVTSKVLVLIAIGVVAWFVYTNNESKRDPLQEVRDGQAALQEAIDVLASKIEYCSSDIRDVAVKFVRSGEGYSSDEEDQQKAAQLGLELSDLVVYRNHFQRDLSRLEENLSTSRTHLHRLERQVELFGTPDEALLSKAVAALSTEGIRSAKGATYVDDPVFIDQEIKAELAAARAEADRQLPDAPFAGLNSIQQDISGAITVTAEITEMAKRLQHAEDNIKKFSQIRELNDLVPIARERADELNGRIEQSVGIYREKIQLLSQYEPEAFSESLSEYATFLGKDNIYRYELVSVVIPEHVLGARNSSGRNALSRRLSTVAILDSLGVSDELIALSSDETRNSSER